MKEGVGVETVRRADGQRVPIGARSSRSIDRLKRIGGGPDGGRRNSPLLLDEGAIGQVPHKARQPSRCETQHRPVRWQAIGIAGRLYRQAVPGFQRGQCRRKEWRRKAECVAQRPAVAVVRYPAFGEGEHFARNPACSKGSGRSGRGSARPAAIRRSRPGVPEICADRHGGRTGSEPAADRHRER